MKNNKLKVKNFKPHNYKDFSLIRFTLYNMWLNFWYKEYSSGVVIYGQPMNKYKIFR